MIMWSAARSLWGEPAVPPLSRVRSDQVLAAIVLATATLEAFVRLAPGWRVAAIAVGCVLAVAVLARRTHGLAAVGLAFGAFAVVDVVALLVDTEPLVLYSGTVVLLLVFSLFRWGRGRDVLLGTGVVVLGFTVTVVADSTQQPRDAVGGAAVLLFAAALGAAIRYRAMVREHLVEQAKLQEREQLARELHDTVAHHLSGIAIQAQAGLVVARSPSPGGAAEALEIIEREAATTLTEMRAMVGALRDRGTPAAMSIRRHLADIERLAAAGAGSLSVEVALRGDLADLPPTLEAALYRVAQESVTNARKHAHLATRIEVTVTGRAADVQLTVRDDGARTAAPDWRGFGLVGMSERVALLGGTLTAGPGPAGGWCVRAVLPRPRSAA